MKIGNCLEGKVYKEQLKLHGFVQPSLQLPHEDMGVGRADLPSVDH